MNYQIKLHCNGVNPDWTANYDDQDVESIRADWEQLGDLLARLAGSKASPRLTCGGGAPELDGKVLDLNLNDRKIMQCFSVRSRISEIDLADMVWGDATTKHGTIKKAIDRLQERITVIMGKEVVQFSYGKEYWTIFFI